MLRNLIRSLCRRIEDRIDRTDAEFIRASGLFDSDWYLNKYPDVRDAGVDPVDHYVRLGWREGRDPSPLFRSSIYLAQHPDAQQSGINPLTHFLQNMSACEQPSSRPDADWQFLAKLLAESPKCRPGADRSAAEQASLHAADGTVAMITRERVRRSHRPTDAPPMNILLVNYGPYDNTSGIHISGFAYALIDLGHRVVISAAGALVEYDADPAAPSCSNVSHRRLRDNPGVLA